MNRILKKAFILGSMMLSVATVAKADKGMWLLNELTKENIAQMKELGFRLTTDSLYSLNKPSVAGSVVIFGRGCTGVTVSKSGLVMTNHHCGYSSIQQVSAVDHDYLRDGFVSHSFDKELPIEGLQIRYLRDIKDVTSDILKQLKSPKDETERIKQLQDIIQSISTAESKRLASKHKEVIIRPYYAGNKYYMLTYDVFNDIRLVFAPPSSIGKYGGDTDNWMWPRHTGDFAVFRVYADKDNQPASYSKDNVPYTPRYFAAVSTQGYKEGDYAMTIGFPGSTQRYIPSWGIENRVENENTPRIEVRGAKQAIWRKAMDSDQATRIKYASKYAQSSNYWKNSIGMNQALKRLGVVATKQAEEASFQKWADRQKNAEYKTVLGELKNNYQSSGKSSREMIYLSETLLGGAELPTLALIADRLASLSKDEQKARVKGIADRYKDYLPELDRKVLPVMLDIARKNIPHDYLAPIWSVIDANYGGSTVAYSKDVFDKSIVPYYTKLQQAVELGTISQVLSNDPAVVIAKAVTAAHRKIADQRGKYLDEINRGNRIYFAGRQLQNPKRPMPSDANSTMRLSYGTIKGYSPRDAVAYSYFTTPRGILEKYTPGSTEFDLPADFLTLLKKGDWGRWSDKKTGKLHVAFLSNNDITGGNSGSPVFDKNGRVIALAFDGNWDAMSGDIEFEPELQRTISVDIRYVLFVIEKWGKCPRLIQELDLR